MVLVLDLKPLSGVSVNNASVWCCRQGFVVRWRVFRSSEKWLQEGRVRLSMFYSHIFLNSTVKNVSHQSRVLAKCLMSTCSSLISSVDRSNTSPAGCCKTTSRLWARHGILLSCKPAQQTKDTFPLKLNHVRYANTVHIKLCCFDPACTERFDEMTSRGPWQPQLFCASVI